MGKAYLRDPWNVLDFVIVVLSFVSALSQQGNLRAFKTLRTTRAIRPLRILSKSKGMKQVGKRAATATAKIMTT
jgi:voltage-dependent calcium channel L type alpha-1D